MNRRKHFWTPHKINLKNSLTWDVHKALIYLERIIKHKFQVKKSLSQRLTETRGKKCSIFALFSRSFSKSLLMVARNRISAEGPLLWHQWSSFIFLFHTLDQGSVHTETSVYIFDLTVKRRDVVWRLQAQGKGKAAEQCRRSQVKELEWPIGQITQQNGLIPRGEREIRADVSSMWEGTRRRVWKSI